MNKFLFSCLLICSTHAAQNSLAQSNITCKSLFLDPYSSLSKKIPKSDVETIRRTEEIALGEGEFVTRAKLLLTKLENFEFKNSNQSSLIVNYASLTYLLKINILKPFKLNEKIKDLLSIHYEKITGQFLSRENAGKPIPKKHLKSLRPEALTFYNASLRHGPQSYKEYFRSYVPQVRDYVILTTISTLALTGMAFHNLGGKYLAAAMTGLAITSFAEYAFHRYGAHASQKLRDLPIIGQLLKGMHFNHSIVHHGVTYKKYTAQFDDLNHKLHVDNFIHGKVKQNNFGERYQTNLVKKSAYGLVLSKKDYFNLVAPVSSLTALIGYFLGFDPIMLTLSTVPTFFYPVGVNFVHKYMHLPRQQVLEKTQNKIVLRKLLNSRYGNLMAQIHYVHHKKVRTNFNLLYPLADIIFGTMKLPDLKELAEIRRQDGLGLPWSDSQKPQ